ncbi:MAG: SDR family NAD(P)-dependent oxidoreductase [Pseudomonadota bacterium]|nr:SDR family NAD(P)-dependent oxidoreductase [Pseudomonadota bacterium]
MSKPVCLVMGAGAGIGGTTAARFAQEGWHAVLCRRSDEAGLQRLVGEIEAAGGSASGRLMNAAEDGAIEACVEEVERDVGPIDVMIFNLGAQIGDRPLAATTPKMFELGWRMATFGLFRLAQSAFPKMLERGGGSLIVTSATAAVRGNRGQHSHASAMGGRRMLCQSLNAEFGPQGIHVAHVIVDGAVDAPDTLGKMLGPERFAQLRETRGGEHDGLILPDQVAETYLHLAHQHRSTWTFEIDLRTFSDTAWWNHS